MDWPFGADASPPPKPSRASGYPLPLLLIVFNDSEAWHQLYEYHFGYTEKPQYNESEGTKEFVLYSRGFVIAGVFNNKINYRGT
jgi:hypothetical protein